MQELHEGWGEGIGERLYELRRSQQWLADACGVHASTISRVISGETNPNDELKWKIAGALGERMDRLFGWPKVIPPSPAREAAEAVSA